MANLPAVLRGVIGTEAVLRGLEPVLVSGYGLVVGLDGTGSSDMPTPVRARMEREMALKGVGQETMGMGYVTPTQMLNDVNTTVVLVQAVIPPGAPKGWRFDVFVSMLPGTSTTSLEGGKLWTTDLQPGLASPTGPQRTALAEAKGDVFINPFAAPEGDTGEDVIDRTTGRVLNGGVVRDPKPLVLLLNTPSHARSRAIASAINSHFPRGSGDRKAVAIPRNEERIEVNIPSRFRKDPVEFSQLMLNTRVDTSFPTDWAVRYTRALRDQPELAQQIAWRIRAIGKPALPFVRDMYDYPEAAPRFSAMEIGANLGDALAAPALLDIARDGPAALRLRAIELLGKLDSSPAINEALRLLLDDDELDIRIAAYEALNARGDVRIDHGWVEHKFRLDLVPAKKTLVYISQQGEPRIVIFGDAPELTRPMFVSVWSDRLMLTADSPAGNIRLFYRDNKTNEITTTSVQPGLADLTIFLAHTSTPEAPEPGLGLSYSLVVGALYGVWKDGGIDGAFVAEQDKLAAEILRAARGATPPERPEGDAADNANTGEAAPAGAGQRPPRPATRPEGGSGGG